MSGFRKRGEKVVFRGSLITVAQATFEAPDGSSFERDVVHHPGAVSVVPVIGDAHDRVLLVRQYRAALDRELLEIPAGKRDVEGEDVAVTAVRELEEEIGMRPGRLDLLVEFYNSPGFSDERAFVFLARDLEVCETSAQGVEERHMTLEEFALADVPGLIAARELVDAKSIIGLSLAREVLAQADRPGQAT